MAFELRTKNNLNIFFHSAHTGVLVTVPTLKQINDTVVSNI